MKRQSNFSAIVWELATSIPEGKVTTYGHLARAAGGGGQAARSITGILSKAPNQRAIPYHRIVYAGGHIWCTKEHEKKRLALYKREGIIVDNNGKIENFDEVLWDFA